MSSMKKRLAKAIRKFGQYDDDDEALAEYLVSKGWRDIERRPVVQHVTVTPNPMIQMMGQQQVTHLPDIRSLPVDHKKTRFV